LRALCIVNIAMMSSSGTIEPVHNFS